MTRADFIKRLIENEWDVVFDEQSLHRDMFRFECCDGIKCPRTKEGVEMKCRNCKNNHFWEEETSQKPFFLKNYYMIEVHQLSFDGTILNTVLKIADASETTLHEIIRQYGTESYLIDARQVIEKEGDIDEIL